MVSISEKQDKLRNSERNVALQSTYRDANREAIDRNIALLEIRFAFDRDIVRRKGYKAFVLRGIITECSVCDKDFDRVRSNQVTCSPECRRLRANQRQMKYDQKVEPERNEKRRDRYADLTYTPTLDDCTTMTPDPTTNLLLAILTSAHLDGDQEFLDDMGPVLMRAVKEAMNG